MVEALALDYLYRHNEGRQVDMSETIGVCRNQVNSVCRNLLLKKLVRFRRIHSARARRETPLYSLTAKGLRIATELNKHEIT